MTERISPELDIIRQNPDLILPPSPELKFIFWAHHEDNVDNLLPHLRDTDVVCLEFSGSKWKIEESHRLNAMASFFNKLNTLTHNTNDKEVLGIQQRASASTEPLGHYIRLAVALAGTGKTLVPVDTSVASAKELEASRALTEHSLESEDSMIAASAYREGLVLRQIKNLMDEFESKDEPSKVAIVYGAHHELLSVAARRLGATVSRVRLTDASIYASRVDEVITRLVRWGIYPSTKSLSEEDQEIAEEARMVEIILPKSLSSADTAYLMSRLKALHSNPEKLEQIQDLLYETLTTTIYSRRADSLNPVTRYRKKKSLQKAGQLFTNLATELQLPNI